jgi:hypothetical protein
VYYSKGVWIFAGGAHELALEDTFRHGAHKGVTLLEMRGEIWGGMEVTLMDGWSALRGWFYTGVQYVVSVLERYISVLRWLGWLIERYMGVVFLIMINSIQLLN